ncbi:MAG: hypothetical protein ACJ75J_15975 [Cytophagaceae bacterium]|jgi:hypothetical protein
MKLKLIPVLTEISSVSDVKKLSPIQLQQMDIEIAAYFGKATSLAEAFKHGEFSIDFYRVTEENKEAALYDFCQANMEAGIVFLPDSTDLAGIEMLECFFGVMAGFEKQASELEKIADALNEAPMEE